MKKELLMGHPRWARQPGDTADRAIEAVSAALAATSLTPAALSTRLAGTDDVSNPRLALIANDRKGFSGFAFDRSWSSKRTPSASPLRSTVAAVTIDDQIFWATNLDCCAAVTRAAPGSSHLCG